MIPVVRKAAEIVGSVRRLAKKIDVYRGSLYQWNEVPATHVDELVEATGGKLTREEIRPDLYGRPQKKRKTA